jgi:hypothetical protein
MPVMPTAPSICSMAAWLKKTLQARMHKL